MLQMAVDINIFSPHACQSSHFVWIVLCNIASQFKRKINNQSHRKFHFLAHEKEKNPNASFCGKNSNKFFYVFSLCNMCMSHAVWVRDLGTLFLGVCVWIVRTVCCAGLTTNKNQIDFAYDKINVFVKSFSSAIKYKNLIERNIRIMARKATIRLLYAVNGKNENRGDTAQIHRNSHNKIAPFYEQRCSTISPHFTHSRFDVSMELQLPEAITRPLLYVHVGIGWNFQLRIK